MFCSCTVILFLQDIRIQLYKSVLVLYKSVLVNSIVHVCYVSAELLSKMV